MFKKIQKIIPPRRFAVPLLGIVVAIAAIAQRAQPVLSKQIALLQTASPSKVIEEEAVPTTWMERNPNNIDSESVSKAARLRKVLDSSSVSQSAGSAVSPGKTYTWIQRNNSSSYEKVSQELDNLSTTQAKISEDKASIKGVAPTTNFPNGDGVFLYGSSRQMGQLGHGYIVFEKRAGKVVGGMYMPSSEFNCFQGNLDSSGEIAMTVKGYVGDISPTQVASNNVLFRLNENEPTNYAYSVTLQDYYQLDAVSKNDLNILKTCKANF
ncbi:hypothetical protein Riv7116_3323 [Rivularia sp. PCC 7116]|uniref:hypothetical protein n=1 Tax=Rivularia sp. PCC 7116 TaxID=373994 RepID=UPI00029EFB42|nr:hypothetical protein [Rivularia sp. PCC 7116]AFY55786.1 hypothetical protein Riv7116_3323 [Rivularia sp. PCC 7116]